MSPDAQSRSKVPRREAKAARAERAQKVLRKLKRLYPGAETELAHHDPFQLLVAVILSAQCTDERVNMVTPKLFAKLPTPQAIVSSAPGELEDLIRSTGFFNNKAKNIRGASQRILDEHDGEVPDTMDELLALPGVARKTANCVLGSAFGKNVGVVVDTHVGRLARRLGFTKQKDPVKVERDLMELFPQPAWTYLSHGLILHGRGPCKARKADCAACKLAELCPQIDV